MSTIKPRAQRICLLRHVCMDTTSSAFSYYRDPNAAQMPIVFDKRYGHIFSFGHVAPKGGREDLLPLNKHVRYKRHLRWSPKMVDGPVPSDTHVLHKLHLVSAPFVPTNLGHLAWEEAFPLLLGMAQLGIYEDASKTVVLRTHACNESVGSIDRGDGTESKESPPTRSEAHLCHKFLEGFMRPLGALTTVSGLAAQHAAAGRRHVCFERVVVGGYYDMFNAEHHAGKEPWLQLYRQRVLAHHALAPPPPSLGFAPPPTAHSFIIVNKQGRRGIYNFDEVVAYLRAACKGLCHGVEKAVQPVAFHTMSVREQLRIVSTATIALSPPGGVSMILPFLPEGAHAILINYMVGEGADTSRLRGTEGTCAKCSLTMEAALWRHVRHVRTLFYQVWDEGDFAPGRSGKRKRASIGRDSPVVVKEERLGFLVRVALDKMARPE